MEKRKKWDSIYYKWSLDADYTRKTGIYPAILSLVRREDKKPLFWLKDGQGVEEVETPCYAKILEEGPTWDCMQAGTDLVVSQRLKDFLEDRTGKDLRFLPIYLKGEKDSKRIDGFYALIFKKLIKAFTAGDFLELDREMLVTSGNIVMEVCEKRDRCLSAFFIDADLAEEMIAAGFTGLGFENRFTRKKPGWRGKNRRLFPEEEYIQQYVREDPARFIAQVATTSSSVKQGWKTLLDEGRKIKPSPVWDNLEVLDVESDLRQQVAWLDALLKTEPPQKSIRAFWFGIFDRAEGEKTEGIATLYASGSDKYDEEERFDFDWACSPKWFPENRYTHSQILNAISKEANRSKSSKLKDALSYFLTLGYAALLVRFLMGLLSNEALAVLGRRKRPIAVGFDEGDALYVGTLSQSGWKKV